jgi:16S rRNA (guanine527-N7)-methyltransferase
MDEERSSVFVEGLRQLGLDTGGTPREHGQGLSDIIARFLLYRQELLDWNSRINLTAITDPEEVLCKHFLDSLSLLIIYDHPRTRLLDIGTGAGFPGIPLKIVRPQWHVTLIESTGKKVAFLRHIIDTLQLDDIQVVHGRAEELADMQEYRASFDLVTARAVSSLSTLLEYSAPYCRVGGQMIFPKKGELAAEIVQGRRAAKQLGATLKADQLVALPGLEDGRRLLVWEQQQLCPANYPRSGSAMAKKPLG